MGMGADEVQGTLAFANIRLIMVLIRGTTTAGAADTTPREEEDFLFIVGEIPRWDWINLSVG